MKWQMKFMIRSISCRFSSKIAEKLFLSSLLKQWANSNFNPVFTGLSKHEFCRAPEPDATTRVPLMPRVYFSCAQYSIAAEKSCSALMLCVFYFHLCSNNYVSFISFSLTLWIQTKFSLLFTTLNGFSYRQTTFTCTIRLFHFKQLNQREQPMENGPTTKLNVTKITSEMKNYKHVNRFNRFLMMISLRSIFIFTSTAYDSEMGESGRDRCVRVSLLLTTLNCSKIYFP